MKTTIKNSSFLPGGKAVTSLALSLILSMSSSLLRAQGNTTYDADAIPLPGGTACVAIGVDCLISNNGNNNTGVGNSALKLNVNGTNNTAIGEEALFNNDGNSNTAMGWQALKDNISGMNNTAVGIQALIVSDADDNTAVGNTALNANNSGDQNSAFGSLALVTNVSGNANSAFGYNTDVSASNLNNATAIGANALVNASNKIRLGDANVTVIEGQPSVYTGSDGRFKSNISEEDVKGLEFIVKLRPVVYNFETKKFQEFLVKNMPDNTRANYLKRDFTKSTALRRSGFIAQEVEKAAKETGYNFDAIHTPENDNDNYSLAYGQFVVPLVKAVQEQQKMIEELQAKLAEQEKKTLTATGIDHLNTDMAGFSMSQNEPNPFTHETVIRYTLPQQVSVAAMNVYDLSGKQVKTFALTEKGAASIVITSDKLAAGIYIYSIIADGKVMDSKRMIVADK